MQNNLRRLKQAIAKPILFGIYGAIGCFLAALLLGEVLLALTKLPPPTQAPPQAIALLIDCSGSMDQGGKLQEAKSAALSFVQRQDLSRNQIAVVGFGSQVQPAASLTGDLTTLQNAIANLSDGGGTRMDSGINAAADQLKSSSLKRNILLFTDGIPDSKFGTTNAARFVRFQGINIIAVATDGADTNYLAEVTGNSSLVFYASSGQFDIAFKKAEAAISSLVESEGTGDLLYSMLRIGGWTGTLALGTAIALIMGQNAYWRRRLLTLKEGSISAGGGLLAGLAAGASGQFLFIPVASIPLLGVVGRVAGWTILGTLLGGGMSFFVPNLKRRRALQGGAIGGGIGAIGFLVAGGMFGDIAGRLVGAIILGFFIGLMIALIEALTQKEKPLLIVHWTPTEQTKIALGATPVILGSSDEAHIYLPKNQGYPPVMAKIFMEGSKVIMLFDEAWAKLKGMTKLKQELADGDRRKIGNITIEVRTFNGHSK